MTGDREALRRERDDLAALLRAHGQASYDPSTGTFTCRSGDYSGPWLADHQAELVQRAVTAARAEAYEQGRRSVGLCDFLPDPCGDEYSSYPWYIAEEYGDYVSCTLRRGHDGKHEHSDSGMTWAATPTPASGTTQVTPARCSDRHTTGDLTVYCGLPPHGDETQHDNHGVRW